MSIPVVPILSILLLSVILLRTLSIVAASFIDVLNMRTLAKTKKPKGRAPKVALQYIVISHNNQDTIAACLQSIATQNPKLPVLVVNNASKDNTLSITKGYTQNAPKNMRLVVTSKRKFMSNTLLVKQIAKKGKGKQFVVLGGNMQLPKNFTAQVRNQLAMHPTLNMLTFTLLPTPSWHVLGVLQAAVAPLQQNVAKAMRALYAHNAQLANIGYLVTPEALLTEVTALPSLVAIYYSPARSLREFAHGLRASVAQYKLPLRALYTYEQLVLLGVTCYALFVFVHQKSSDLLLFMVGIALFWLLLGIWSQYGVSVRQKLRSTYFVPTLLVTLPFVALLKISTLLLPHLSRKS